MSYSPYYKQDVIWVAEYNDGNILREWDDSGKEHPFREIDKSKLRKFHLVSEKFDYYLDCKTGLFNVDGREFVFPLAGLELNYAEGLIHYKDAFTEFVPKTNVYSGFGITAYNFGFKAVYGNVKSQVVFNVTEKAFNVEITFINIQKSLSWRVKI